MCADTQSEQAVNLKWLDVKSDSLSLFIDTVISSEKLHDGQVLLLEYKYGITWKIHLLNKTPHCKWETTDRGTSTNYT